MERRAYVVSAPLVLGIDGGLLPGGSGIGDGLLALLLLLLLPRLELGPDLRLYQCKLVSVMVLSSLVRACVRACVRLVTSVTHLEGLGKVLEEEAVIAARGNYGVEDKGKAA
jgi:hypothetical protein